MGLKLAGSILVTWQTTKQKGIVPPDTPELAPQTLLIRGFLGSWLSPGIREATPQAALWDGSCCSREETQTVWRLFGILELALSGKSL